MVAGLVVVCAFQPPLHVSLALPCFVSLSLSSKQTPSSPFLPSFWTCSLPPYLFKSRCICPNLVVVEDFYPLQHFTFHIQCGIWRNNCFKHKLPIQKSLNLVQRSETTRCFVTLLENCWLEVFMEYNWYVKIIHCGVEGGGGRPKVGSNLLFRFWRVRKHFNGSGDGKPHDLRDVLWRASNIVFFHFFGCPMSWYSQVTN